ncbi:hypothetical protein F4801DRAFT_544797 [Xylaria longipes]|nr:hypothetical protein F4801DRAFT_544797 [Xylaria longipes]RYC62250.1 hypothetical protein CHU98_g3967 [Xylaria longipes]
MSPATRIFAQRSSALRTLTRRQAVSARPAYVSPAARRGYASAHGAAAAAKSSDMPWLLSSVGVTAVGLAFLLSTAPKTSKAGHGPKSADAAIEAHHEEKEDDKASSGSDEDKEPKQEKEEEEKPQDDTPKGAADPSAPGKASQSGQNVPPPSGDNADLATKWDEKKEGQEESKEATRAGETKAATSSSETPSKKTQAEDPREDPQKGEGEAVQKGSSKD